jgi:hypothetical protein
MDRVRHDWFNRAGLVHVSIFCRSAVPQGTRVESDGLKLNVTVAHGFGALETVKQFDLFGEIVPSESVVRSFLDLTKQPIDIYYISLPSRC